ncbi:TPA: hypothetical protein ACUA4C_004836 [Escherichia coli]
MDTPAFKSDVEKLKLMIADYRQKTPPAIRGEVVREYNYGIIVVCVILVSAWAQAAFFQNIISFFLAFIYTIIFFIAACTCKFPPLVGERKIQAVWERDYITEADFDIISSCSEDFRVFLLQSTNNDLTNLTYNRLENIVEKYNRKSEQDKLAESSKERLGLS